MLPCRQRRRQSNGASHNNTLYPHHHPTLQKMEVLLKSLQWKVQCHHGPHRTFTNHYKENIHQWCHQSQCPGRIVHSRRHRVMVGLRPVIRIMGRHHCHLLVSGKPRNRCFQYNFLRKNLEFEESWNA